MLPGSWASSGSVDGPGAVMGVNDAPLVCI